MNNFKGSTYILVILLAISVYFNLTARDPLGAYGEGTGKNVYGFPLPDLANNFIVIDGETKNIYHYQINFSQGVPRFVLRNVTNMRQDYRYFLRGK